MIRLAKIEDLPQILSIYCVARQLMRAGGNPNQWDDGYPSEKLLVEDIAKQQLYVEETDGALNAVFVLAMGDDPTYACIEGGEWLSDSPYGTIHRIASNGKKSGFFVRCLEFCKSQTAHLRIDTHHDNVVMQHLAQKHGFVRCGVIHLADGSPRIAYETV